VANAQTREGWAAAVHFYERASTIDPEWAEAKAHLASSLVGRTLDFLTDTPAEDIQRAHKLAADAIAKSPRSMIAHHAKAQVFRAQRHWEEAILEYEKAIELDRCWPYAYAQLSSCKLLARGSLDQAASLAEQAIRLSPRDPGIGNWFWRLGFIDVLRSRTDQAIAWFEKARNANPANVNGHAGLASAYGLKGDKSRGAAALAEAQRLSNVYSSIAQLKQHSPYAEPNSKISELVETTYLAGLRIAGLPEE
jgi:tetratricopeptide (TPR) repeat protein